MPKSLRFKFGNVPKDGFHSTKEYRRYQELVLMEKLGLISSLRTQVKYEVIPKQKGERAAHYIADFVYLDGETGKEIVEDTKSKATKTPAYVIKRKLLLLNYGIRIKET